MGKNNKNKNKVNDLSNNLFFFDENNSEYSRIEKKENSPFFLKSPINNFKPPRPIPMKKTFVNINVEINCIQDLIDLCDKYPLSNEFEYNINMEAIHNIRYPITKLNNMIGMKSLKEQIVDQILYFSQYFHVGSNDFMHTVIYGPPGTGKTEISKILG